MTATPALEEQARPAEVLALVPGAAYAVVNPVALDGRLSWYPRHVRGVAPVTSYVLVEPGEALLIDTGLTAHRAQITAALRSLLLPGTTLRILHTRLGEYASICNSVAVLREFCVRSMYGTFPARDWVTFEPDSDDGPARDRLWQGVSCEILGPSQTIELAAGARRIQVFSSPLRLLPAHWVYDELTATLCTADSFSAVFRPGFAGPWTAGSEDDPATLASVREHLRAERYWWIEEADTSEIRRQLRERLGAWRIDRIAPAYGCIIEGRRAVARHLAWLDRVLAGEPAAMA